MSPEKNTCQEGYHWVRPHCSYGEMHVFVSGHWAKNPVRKQGGEGMNYKDIKEYYGKTVVIYHTLGVKMFDFPVRILPKEEQGNNWRYHLHLTDGQKEYSTWISSIGKIEVVS